MVELPSLGGPFDDVLAVNASGVLVGLSSFKGIADERAVMWTPAPFGAFAKLEPPPALNGAKAGKTVDLTFSLGGDQGLDIFADGYPATRAINCESGEPEEDPTPALGTLSYDPSRDLYTYAWLTVARGPAAASSRCSCRGARRSPSTSDSNRDHCRRGR